MDESSIQSQYNHQLDALSSLTLARMASNLVCLHLLHICFDLIKNPKCSTCNLRVVPDSSLYATNVNGDGDPDLPSDDGNYRCGGE